MRALWGTVLSGLAWSGAYAQRHTAGVLPPVVLDSAWLRDARRGTDSEGTSLGISLGAASESGGPRLRESYWAVAASMLLPGAGQAILGERRFLPYAAFELFALALYAGHARAARARRDDYRNIAATVARGRFSDDRPTGDFDYYERLEHYIESGQYDAISGGVIDPESDTVTYNGSIWFLARRTFWKDVNVVPARSSDEWQLAERFYRRRAYRDEFRWSWRNAQLEFDEYRRLIRGANDSNRRAVQDLGLVIANHALSMVDAYVTIRVRRRVVASGPRQEMSITVPVGRR